MQVEAAASLSWGDTAESGEPEAAGSQDRAAVDLAPRVVAILSCMVFPALGIGWYSVFPVGGRWPCCMTTNVCQAMEPEQEFLCSPDVGDSQVPEPWPLASVSMRNSRWYVELSEAAEGTKRWAGVSPGRPYKRQVDRVLRPQPFPGVRAQGQPSPC